VLQNHTTLKEALFSRDRRNILELGSGTGIVALTIGALRSFLGLTDAGTIITTDLRTYHDTSVPENRLLKAPILFSFSHASSQA